MYKTEIETVDIPERDLLKAVPDLKIPEGYEVTDCDATAVVEWDVEIEGRSWGIKSIFPTVSKATITLDMVLTEKNNDLDERKEIECQHEFVVDDLSVEQISSGSNGICPDLISFDRNRKWTVEF
jgi:hypothetical protein